MSKKDDKITELTGELEDAYIDLAVANTNAGDLYAKAATTFFTLEATEVNDLGTSGQAARAAQIGLLKELFGEFEID